jgi:hypothetical protein
MVLVIHSVNSIILNPRLFNKLCTEIGAAPTEMLLCIKSRWLSEVKVLENVYDLYEELKEFSYQKGIIEFKDLFSQDEKLNQTTCLEDKFGLLNDLNISLQSLNSRITDFHDKSFQIIMNLRI